MSHLASVAGVLLLVAAYATAESTIIMRENTSITLSLAPGSYIKQKLLFVAEANATYNVRFTRLWTPFKRNSTHTVCVSESQYAACTIGANVTGKSQGLYSAYIDATKGKKYYVTVASQGEGFSYSVRMCRGKCSERCSEDCNGRGACTSSNVCRCDRGAGGESCSYKTNNTSEIDFDDIGSALAAMIGVFLMSVFSFATVVISSFLPCIVVSMCACCAVAMSARTRRGRVIARAQQQQQQQRSAQNIAQPQVRAPAPVYVPLPPPVTYARPISMQPLPQQQQKQKQQQQQPAAQTPAQPPRQQQQLPPPPPPLYVSLYPSLA